MPPKEKHYWWIITLNNPTKNDREAITSPPDFVREAWYQEEIGSTGTLHFQMAVHTDQSRPSAIKEWLKRAHIEVAQNKNKVINYCRKKETSVENTFRYYKRPNYTETAVLDEEPNEEGWTMRVILQTLAQFVQWENLELNPVGMTKDTMAAETYEQALNTILKYRPELVDKLTGSRVYPAWKLTWRTQMNLWDAFLNSPQEEPAEASIHPKEWLGLPEVWDVSNGVIEIKTEDCI